MAYGQNASSFDALNWILTYSLFEVWVVGFTNDYEFGISVNKYK